MQRRTQSQIEKDYKIIREAAKTAKTFKELEKITGLKHSEIQISLSKHPRAYERIKKAFADYGKSTKAQPKASKINVDTKAIVIDTSITGVEGIENLLETDSASIILTSVVIKELSQMQHFDDASAMRARHILAMPADYEDKFVHELIDESFDTADKCILEYCKQNADNVILYTADKEMYNFAKIYRIPVKLFKLAEETKKSKIITLLGAFRLKNDLIIDLDSQNTTKKSMSVFSEGVIHDEGIVKFKVGDDVFLASKKKAGYIAFAHYKITSLWKENNAMLVFSRRLYDLNKLDFNHEYKSFLRDFKRKIAV